MRIFLGAAQIYVELGLKPTSRTKSLPELKLKRVVQGWLIAARPGHGHFSAYHKRFEHEETDTYCTCGQKRAQLHPFSCPSAREHRPQLWCKRRQKQLAPEEVLMPGFRDRYYRAGTTCPEPRGLNYLAYSKVRSVRPGASIRR